MRKIAVVLILLCLAAALLAPAVLRRGEQTEEGRESLVSWVKDYFAAHESGEIAEHLHAIFRETAALTDEELDAEIRAAAEGVSLHLSDAQVAWVRRLCRKYERLDTDALRERVEEWKEHSDTFGRLSEYMDSFETAGDTFRDAAREVGTVWDSSKDAFTNLRDIFQGFAGTEADLERYG